MSGRLRSEKVGNYSGNMHYKVVERVGKGFLCFRRALISARSMAGVIAPGGLYILVFYLAQTVPLGTVGAPPFICIYLLSNPIALPSLSLLSSSIHLVSHTSFVLSISRSVYLLCLLVKVFCTREGSAACPENRRGIQETDRVSRVLGHGEYGGSIACKLSWWGSRREMGKTAGEFLATMAIGLALRE